MTKRARIKRDRLALACGGLVEYIANRVLRSLPRSFDLDDLIGAGNLGLLRAAETYDPAAHDGTPFSAFARTWIRGAILDSVGRRSATHGHTNNRYLENTRSSKDAPPAIFSFEDPAYSTGGTSKIPWKTEAQHGMDLMAHQPIAPVFIDRARKYNRVSEAISWLSDDERAVLRVWYADDEPRLRDVARRMGMRMRATEELHDRAVAKLRARINGGAIQRSA